MTSQRASPRWRLLDRMVLVATFLGLLVPGALLAAGVHVKSIENRPLAAFPVISLEAVLDGTWFRGVDAYLSDNVALRPYAIRVRGEVIRRTGGTGNPQVIKGAGNWLFTRTELEPACTFDASAVIAAIRDAAARVEAKGGTFRFLAVPDKHDIYPEQLPDNPFPATCTDAERVAFRAGLATMGPVGIDGWTPLIAVHATDPEALLYWPGDTHWTALGAIQAIRPLITSIDPSLWTDSTVEIKGTRDRTVDLELQLGVRRVAVTPHVIVRPATVVTRTDLSAPVEIHNARAIFTTTTAGPDPTVPGRTLILYDSFFGIDVNLVAPFFADATWVHIGDIGNHPELAQVLGPFDTVIVERVERGIYLTDFATTFSRLDR